MRIRWSSVAEYIESGKLVATVMDGDVTTNCTITLDLGKVFSGWRKMKPHERYAAGNGTKQVVSDGATKGTAREKIEKIENNFSDLVAGVMPGMGSRVSMFVKALAREFDVSETEALAAWDSYDDEKKAQVQTYKKIKKHVADIQQERLDAEKERLAAEADNEEELEFTL